MDYITLGKQLAEMRRAIRPKMNQEAVAAALGDVSRQMVSHWEKGRGSIGVPDLERLVAVYGRRLIVKWPEKNTPTMEIVVDRDVADIAEMAGRLTADQRALLRELAEVLPKLPAGTRDSLPVMVNGWRRDFLYTRDRAPSQ